MRRLRRMVEYTAVIAVGAALLLVVCLGLAFGFADLGAYYREADACRAQGGIPGGGVGHVICQRPQDVIQVRP